MPVQHQPEPIKSPLGALAVGIAVVAALVAVLIFFDVHEQLVELLEWADAQRALEVYAQAEPDPKDAA